MKYISFTTGATKFLCLNDALNSMLVQYFFTSTEEGGYVFGSVCLSVCPSDYSQTCERILTKFFGGVGHGSRTKWYKFGGDPDHGSDLGVQSPKSGSSKSAEVCSLSIFLVNLVSTTGPSFLTAQTDMTHLSVWVYLHQIKSFLCF